MRAKNMQGMRFGMLTVGNLVPGENKAGRARWECKCDCGNTRIIVGAELRAGKVKSCGCYRSSVLASSGFRHGGHGTPEWKVWTDMLRRCEKPARKAYKHYGARGIKVCERWHDFTNFVADMGPRMPGMSLERKDVNGDYEPGNCIWIPLNEQSKNTRRTVRVKVNGNSMCLADACRTIGVSRSRTQDRIKKLGWTFDKAVTEPKKVNGTTYSSEVQK